MLTFPRPKNYGTEFWFGSQFSGYGPKQARNGPKRKKSNYSHSFQGMMLIILDNVDPPKAQKIMEQNFDLGPSFRVMVQNGSKVS